MTWQVRKCRSCGERKQEFSGGVFRGHQVSSLFFCHVCYTDPKVKRYVAAVNKVLDEAVQESATCSRCGWKVKPWEYSITLSDGTREWIFHAYEHDCLYAKTVLLTFLDTDKKGSHDNTE